MICLTHSELWQGAVVGLMRQIENIFAKSEHAHEYKGDGDWQMHVEGALCEIALAKFLGVYWKGKGKKRQPDVGDHDVRGTPHAKGHLPLHPDDDDDRRYYLLTGKNGAYEVRGWILGRNGKLDKYWGEMPGQKGRPAFWIPQSDLVPP